MIALYHMVLSESLGQSMVPTSVPALIKTSVGSPADQLECKLTPRRGEAKRSKVDCPSVSPIQLTLLSTTSLNFTAPLEFSFNLAGVAIKGLLSNLIKHALLIRLSSASMNRERVRRENRNNVGIGAQLFHTALH